MKPTHGDGEATGRALANAAHLLVLLREIRFKRGKTKATLKAALQKAADTLQSDLDALGMLDSYRRPNGKLYSGEVQPPKAAAHSGWHPWNDKAPTSGANT